MQRATLLHMAACDEQPHRSYRFSCSNRSTYPLVFAALVGASLSGGPVSAHATEPAVSPSPQGTALLPSVVSSGPVATPETVRPHAKPKRPIAEEHLDAWFQTVSLSYLLSHNADALRRQDVSAGYFVSEQAAGNRVPALKPLPGALPHKGFVSELTEQA